MIFVGCDPGKTGFLTIYDEENQTHRFFQIPLMHDRLDSRMMYSMIDQSRLDMFDIRGLVTIYVEDVHSLFGMSAKSNFSFGQIYGSILAVTDMFCDTTLVQPKEWQKVMHQGIEKNEDKKVMSLQAAQRLFPDMDFKRTDRCTTPDHNLVDSLLICEYARIKYYENRS